MATLGMLWAIGALAVAWVLLPMSRGRWQTLAMLGGAALWPILGVLAMLSLAGEMRNERQDDEHDD